MFVTSLLPTRLLAATTGVALALAAMFTAETGHAQSPFSPAITVNEDVISHYELRQREEFLRLLGFPGDPVEVAREGLIADRLKQQVIESFDVEVPEEAVREAMAEFASRADLELDQFLQGLAQEGIAEETLRDFVRADIAWRDYIASRYRSRARPTDSEIDLALAAGGAAAGVRVLLSEIIIPVTPANAEEVAALSEDLSQIRNPEEFSQAAARYSATETRTRGGRMDWMALSELPQNLQPALLALSPGEVTAPLQLPNAVALFQLRDIQEIAAPTPRYSAIDYAAYYIPGGRSPEGLQQAAELKARVDTCDDLYGVAKGQPPQVLDRESVAPAQIPQDIALELAKLDPGEVSTALTRNNGQTLVFLMLCSRTSAQNAEATREQVANALTQRRLAAFAESELEQLQAEATIVEQ